MFFFGLSNFAPYSKTLVFLNESQYIDVLIDRTLTLKFDLSKSSKARSTVSNKAALVSFVKKKKTEPE